MEFSTFTLPNGIRCIHKQVRSAVVHCAVTINTGSRDELPSEHGIAHLTEHSLFKGTARRKAYHINNLLENLGGELNAFTTKEETVVHTTTLRSDFPKAIDLLADIVFGSTFPAREVEKEKEIIADEINSYKDSPAERIFDDFEDLLFAGSSLGHNILGSKAAVAKYGRQQITDFTLRTYNTDQMVVSAIGNISEKRFKDIIRKELANRVGSTRNFTREPVPVNAPFEKSLNRSSHQAHCLIGRQAYGMNDARRPALALLANILGGPAANSLLNTEVREKNGLSYNVEAGYTALSDTGLATIYFSTEKEKTDRCLELINKQLDRIKTTSLSARRLSMAKKQFIGQLSIALESNEGYMLGAARSFLANNEIDDLHTTADKILAVTASDILEAANEIFSDTSMLIYK